MKTRIKKIISSIIESSSSALSINSILDKINIKINKPELKHIINSLKQEGKIITTKKGKIISVANSGRIAAEIVSQSKNFSFAKSLYSNEEIYISKYDIKSAIIGDKVILCKIKNSEKGLSGTIEKIIEPGSHFSTGKVVTGLRGELEVICDIPIKYNIPIAKGFSGGANIGDKIKLILSRDNNTNNLFGKVIKVYGNASTAKICADAAIDLHCVPLQFSEGSLKQAKKIASSLITDEEISSRLDLRKENIFTIDSEDSKDLDDAISIKKLRSGWELGVHIADVSHYIKINTELDKTAFSRGTSIYFANRVIPMLPESISNGVCSLNPGEDKLTFSIIINLDKNGNIINYKLAKSIINSKLRGIYNEINKILTSQSDSIISEKYKYIQKDIFYAKELSDILTKNSKIRGVIDIPNTEPKFVLDKNGKCIEITPKMQGASEKIIENFMITANSVVALYAKTLNLPFVYRVHNNPDPQKLESLAKFVGLLGLNSYKIREGVTASDLSNLIEHANGSPTKAVLSRQILRALPKAFYSPKPVGHFGLSLADYCHFTSPIRRYPDICIHRILTDLIRGENIKNINKKYKDLVHDISKKSTECEIRAMNVERESEKYYMAEFMAQHLNQVYSGIVSSTNSKGVFVELDNGVSGFIDLLGYPEYNFIFDGFISFIDINKNKKISIGERIDVKVSAVNISSATIDFTFA